jgi:hypothetical protein
MAIAKLPQPEVKSLGIFHFEVEGLTEEEVHRFRETLDIIISQGVLALHDGKAILSFDYEGRLRNIHYDFEKWRKAKTS